MRVLAIGAHPDDIELACSGTLAKCVERGDTVIVCHASSGNLGHVIIPPDELTVIRANEAKRAGAMAGIEVIWGGFNDLDIYEENKEARVLAGSFTGAEEILARVGCQRPVSVLTGTVDAGKGLFMQKADQIVSGGDLLHDRHDQLVVIARGVGIGIDGRHFMLAGSAFIVLGLGQNAKPPQLLIHIAHEGGHACADGAKVVIVKVLTFGRLRAKERAPRQT